MKYSSLSPLSLGSLTAAAITALVIGSGCTLKKSDQRVIRIELPKTASATRMALERPASASSVAGTSLANFTCFGLNILGPGIPNDPRLRCRANPIGRLGGLVPVENGAIEVAVPAGPGRVVQLFAVTSSVGCPDLNAVFDEMERTQRGPQGLSDPYKVGEARVDLYEDTSVQINARYDSTSPRMFEGCSGPGSGAPPTAAYTGSVAESGIPNSLGHNVLPLKDSQAPSNLAGAPEISGAAAPVSAIAGLHGEAEEYDLGKPHLGHSVNGVTAPSGVRAAIQLQWDISQFDLAQNPKGHVRLNFRGGAEGSNCGKPASVVAGVWDQLHGYWIPVGRQDAYDAHLRWGWGEHLLLPVPLADLAVLKNDGKKYVILNVESSYASASPGCSSAVRVVQAGLSAVSAANTSHGVESLWAQANLPYADSGGGNAFVIPQLGQATIAAHGGIPPYQFSVQSGPGSIDPVTGRFTAGGVNGTATIQIQDSQATPFTQNFNIQVLAPSATAGLHVIPVSLNRAFTAGICEEIQVHRFALDGSGPTALSQSFTLSAFSDGRPAGDFYTNAGCSPSPNPGQISGTIAPGTSFTSVWFRPLLAQAHLPLRAQDGTVAISGLFDFAIAPGSASQLLIFGPRKLSVGSCVPYKVVVADSFENPVLNPGSYTFGFSPPPSASFYSDAVCSSGPSGSLPGGTHFQSLFVMPNASGAAGLMTAAVTGAPTLSPGNFQVNFVASGDPANLVISGPTTIQREQCVQMDLKRVDSSGTPQGPATSENVKLYTDAGMDVYANSVDCTNRSNSIQFMNPSITFAPSQHTLSIFVRSWFAGGSGVLRAETTPYANLNPFKIQLNYAPSPNPTPSPSASPLPP